MKKIALIVAILLVVVVIFGLGVFRLKFVVNDTPIVDIDANELSDATYTIGGGLIKMRANNDIELNKKNPNTKTWTWVSTTYSDGTIVKPVDSKMFALILNSDQTFFASTDCNNISGKYTTDEYKVSFEQIASTLMYCDASQEKDFIKSLQEAVEYKFNSSGEFTLLLKDNGGVAVFR
ncbi:MAG TPA: hypothetical protein DCS23_00695 [Candidatus Yonathbacteria bacterium]|nr:hypothetical protein [Candidatus Yonathbacteria bacterium]